MPAQIGRDDVHADLRIDQTRRTDADPHQHRWVDAGCRDGIFDLRGGLLQEFVGREIRRVRQHAVAEQVAEEIGDADTDGVDAEVEAGGAARRGDDADEGGRSACAGAGRAGVPVPVLTVGGRGGNEPFLTCLSDDALVQ